MEKILELSFGQYFPPAAVLERAQSSPRAPRRQVQLCRAGRHGAAGMVQGSTEAGSKWSQCLPTVGTALTALHQAELNRVLGMTEDLGVTCGGWRGKGREGQEPRDSELNGSGWNATSYQGAWGLSLPIWEMRQRRPIREWCSP